MPARSVLEVGCLLEVSVQKNLLGSGSATVVPRFVPLQQDPFSTELIQRVRRYFNERNLSSKGDLRMWGKSAFFLLGYVGVFLGIVFSGADSFVILGLWVLMGLLKVGIGFNVGHDALHGAYSTKDWINDVMGHSYTMIGAHGFTWKILHNRIHHTYTNIVEGDGDLHGISWLRFFRSQVGLKPYHRFQHWYAPFLYSLTTLVWVFRKDFQHIQKNRHMLCDKPPLPRFEKLKLWGMKLGYLGVFLVIPVVVGSQSVGLTLMGFVLMHLVAGLLMALVFQLGHIVEPAKVYRSADKGLPSWHRLQVEGSSNFCTQNPFLTWFCGGLNFQIEHHLFPQICHVHYPALAGIVEDCSRIHGVSYNNFSSLSDGLKSHFAALKANGAPTGAREIP